MIDEIFRYPKSRHKRREAPPQFSAYESYKPYLRREFGRTCVFCRAHDGLEGEQAFAVEHYLPKKQHPTLRTEYANLYYACLRCNSFKASWPYARRGKAWVRVAELVPNPCDHVMAHHLWMEGVSLEVKGRSKDGEFTCDLLHLNARARFRRNARELYAKLDRNRVLVKAKMKAIRRRVADPSCPAGLRFTLQQLAAQLQHAQDLAERDFQETFGPPA